MVVGSVLPLFGLMALDVAQDRDRALGGAYHEVADYARLTAVRQSRLFDDAARLLTTLQTIPVVGVRGGAECDGQLGRLIARNPQFMTIGVVRADGMIVCHNSLTRAQRFGDMALLATTLDSSPDEIVVGRMILGRVSKRLTILNAKRLPEADGQPGAMVFVSLDLSGFAALAGRFDESVGKTMMVVDARDGSVVAGSGPSAAYVGDAFREHPLMAAIRDRLSGGALSTVGLGGGDEIVAVAPLHRSRFADIVVVASTDRAAALAAANRSVVVNMVVSALVAAAAIMTTALLAHRTLVEPIARLTVAAERVGRGDTSAQTSMKRWQPVEMRKLSSTLNRMADRLDASNRQLAMLANEDGLTKLANRRRFDEALAAQCRLRERANQSLSLLLVDVDHFKAFNDTYGHLAGDDCLKRISERLKWVARRPGDLAARYGGEEFAIVLPCTDQAGAKIVAEIILEVVAELGVEQRSSTRGRVSVSVGSATIASGGTVSLTPQRLIALADEALYEAKSTGRSRHCARNAGPSLAVGAEDGELRAMQPRTPSPLMMGKGGGRYV